MARNIIIGIVVAAVIFVVLILIGVVQIGDEVVDDALGPDDAVIVESPVAD
ncbi:hypothetical protein OCGS_1003 [Oceaniovalibus guishaninsula JLT2003]|uniref:Uncharacterized protein n=1 Tax=Oceaniovalibus guishaninsula JLT2003 TaxID=1231392 RepID=K2HBV7_9RHOB|nr:hypothetical protein [Oceaniovalibus guishaninsula]EKE44968.1 hypothetical protein OCGS_1003 [Oceaniovalibus guishaninsula JLT2003]